MEQRTILHVDMDAFYASVEQRRRPELRGQPVIVGGTGRRGVVAAASYEARAYGVHSAMPSLRAQRLCPHAHFLPGDHAHYAEVSGEIMGIFRDVTPLVEPLSLDEAFLDVTGARRLHGDGARIAAMIRDRVHREQDLTCSVGVAPNKFLAKLATEQGKPRASTRGPIPGTGVTVVAADGIEEFLRPLPVRALWGVGPKTHEKLARIGVSTVADLADLPAEAAVRALGDATGRHLHDLAHGRDDRPVIAHAEPKSISHEETFPVDLHDRDALHVELVRMADAVGRRARRHQLPGRTVTIKVRFGDFSTITRSVTVGEPVDDGGRIVAAAQPLLDAVDIGRGVRLFGVGLTSLGAAPATQLSLLDEPSTSAATPAPGPSASPLSAGRRAVRPSASPAAVTAALDAVRDRFGDDALLPATLARGGSLRAKRLGDRQWGPDRAEGPETPESDPSDP